MVALGLMKKQEETERSWLKHGFFSDISRLFPMFRLFESSFRYFFRRKRTSWLPPCCELHIPAVCLAGFPSEAICKSIFSRCRVGQTLYRTLVVSRRSKKHAGGIPNNPGTSLEPSFGMLPDSCPKPPRADLGKDPKA